MKVIIDRLNCVSCGTCWEICPDFLKRTPTIPSSQVIERFRIEGNNAGGIPPIELEACTVDAADLCPASVISIEE